MPTAAAPAPLATARPQSAPIASNDATGDVDTIRGIATEVFAGRDVKLGLEGIVSKRHDCPYSSGRSPHCIKSKNLNAPAVKRETEEDWANERLRRARSAKWV